MYVNLFHASSVDDAKHQQNYCTKTNEKKRRTNALIDTIAISYINSTQSQWISAAEKMRMFRTVIEMIVMNSIAYQMK